MKLTGLAFFILLTFLNSASAQWIKQSVNTTASFRGLSVVSEKVVWASGTGGTVIKTTDGGMTWKVMTVSGAEKLDFRDIEAFDAKTAYILSIGNGESSRIYKTIDGGATWNAQFINKNEKAFFDAIACWDKKNCIAMSDPVDNRFVLIETKDGSNWSPIDTSNMPATLEGEAAFAASGTCLITQGRNNVFLASGGMAARVFRSADRGKSWSVAETPIVHGTSGAGIFSIAMSDTMNGIIVGGNYEKPDEHNNNLAFTDDGGRTWRKAVESPNGYRSGLAYLGKRYAIVVGSSGSDLSYHYIGSWRSLDKLNYNSVAAKGRKVVWAVGPNGMVARLPLASFRLEK